MASVNLLLFGKIGNGKSATGNSIVGKNVFGREDFAVQSSQFKGRHIKVVDGLSVDTKLYEKEVQDLHQTAARAMSNDHFHSIIIVLKYGSRLTQADKDILRVLRLTFGKGVVSKHGVVVLTNGDVFEGDQDDGEEQGRGRITFEQWCSQQTGFFREIVEECKNRIVLFNNREKSQEKKVQQLESLMAQVDAKWEAVYTMNDFENAKGSRELHLLEAREPALRENVKQKVAEFKAQLQTINGFEPRIQVGALRTLLSDVEHFSQNLERRYKQLQDPELRSQGQEMMRGCTQPVSILESEIRSKLDLLEMKPWSAYPIGDDAAVDSNVRPYARTGCFWQMIRDREHYVFIGIILGEVLLAFLSVYA